MSLPCLALDRRAALVAAASLLLPRRPYASGHEERRPDTALAAKATASMPLPELATPYHDQVDPARCLVSEKYDGVRALWDGRVLRHRSGRPLAATPAFLAGLPAEPLDGELWLGRGRFEPLSALVRRTSASEVAWSSVRYMVFDQPLAGGSFQDRLARLATVLSQSRGAAELAPQWRVGDRAGLQSALDRVVAGGGEGLVLHVGAALHVAGRSDAVFKLKPALDAEARVVGHRNGHGKYDRLLGALEVEMPSGQRFYLGSGLSDADRRDPPPIGALVTYRYRDLTSGGVPRFATYLRRCDED